MSVNNEDLRSLERKIGEIVGIISPIPNQLGRLFEKLDKETQDRMSIDSDITSNYKSIGQTITQLSSTLQNAQNDINNIKSSVGNIRCEEHTVTIVNINNILDEIKLKVSDLVRLLEVRDGKSTITESVNDLKRIMKLKQGDSDWVDNVNDSIETLQEQVKSIINNKKSITSVIKYVCAHIISIIITLMIAYLMLYFGLK